MKIVTFKSLEDNLTSMIDSLHDDLENIKSSEGIFGNDAVNELTKFVESYKDLLITLLKPLDKSSSLSKEIMDYGDGYLEVEIDTDSFSIVSKKEV